MPDRIKTSQLAAVYLSAAIGRGFATRTAAEWVFVWPNAGDRARLWDFEPAPNKPGIPGLDPQSEAGAGGYGALLDLCRRVRGWVMQNVAAGTDMTVADFDMMEGALAEAGTWACSDDLADSDLRLAILEASGY